MAPSSTRFKQKDVAEVWHWFRSALAAYDFLRKLEPDEQTERCLDKVAEVVAYSAEELRAREAVVGRVRTAGFGADG